MNASYFDRDRPGVVGVVGLRWKRSCPSEIRQLGKQYVEHCCQQHDSHDDDNNLCAYR